MDVERDMEPYADKDPGAITATVSWKKNPDKTTTIEKYSKEILIDEMWECMVEFYGYGNIENVINQDGWKLLVDKFTLSNILTSKYHQSWITRSRSYQECIDLEKVAELLVEISMIMNSDNPLTIKVTYPDKEAYINSKLCIIS